MSDCCTNIVLIEARPWNMALSRSAGSFAAITDGTTMLTERLFGQDPRGLIALSAEKWSKALILSGKKTAFCSRTWGRPINVRTSLSTIHNILMAWRLFRFR